MSLATAIAIPLPAMGSHTRYFSSKPSNLSPGPPALMYSAKGEQASQDPRNCWEVPDDQIVLHKVDTRPVTRSRNRTIQELRLIHAMVNTSRLWPQNSASTQGGVISAVINLKAHRSKSRTFNRTSTVIGDWKTLNIECIQAQTESLQLQLPTTKSGSDDDLKAEM